MEYIKNYFRDRANKIANENEISSGERELFIEYYTKFFIPDENEKKQRENFEWWEDNVKDTSISLLMFTKKFYQFILVMKNQLKSMQDLFLSMIILIMRGLC